MDELLAALDGGSGGLEILQTFDLVRRKRQKSAELSRQQAVRTAIDHE
jgi:hypothetical protein